RLASQAVAEKHKRENNDDTDVDSLFDRHREIALDQASATRCVEGLLVAPSWDTGRSTVGHAPIFVGATVTVKPTPRKNRLFPRLIWDTEAADHRNQDRVDGDAAIQHDPSSLL